MKVAEAKSDKAEIVSLKRLELEIRKMELERTES